jgi:hypothetical protein
MPLANYGTRKGALRGPLFHSDAIIPSCAEDESAVTNPSGKLPTIRQANFMSKTISFDRQGHLFLYTILSKIAVYIP